MGGVNPKYWVAAMSSGIFFEIWPFEKGMTGMIRSYGVNSRVGFMDLRLGETWLPANY